MVVEYILTRQTTSRLFRLLALVLAVQGTDQFTVVRTTPTSCRQRPQSTNRGVQQVVRYMDITNSDGISNSSNDFFEYSSSEDQSLKDMEALVLELSADTDDTSRRQKLASLFDEKLNGNRSNGDHSYGISFANLFNQALIKIGDGIRMEATLAAQNSRQDSSDDPSNDLPSFPLPSQQKSQTELQLWALVDMMVQSKTLVKKATGQLGSEGKFG